MNLLSACYKLDVADGSCNLASAPSAAVLKGPIHLTDGVFSTPEVQNLTTDYRNLYRK